MELESDDLSNQHKIALTPIDSEKQKIITELNLQPVDKTMYTVFTVAKDYELRELVKMELGHDYKRGYAFYEFQHDFESISDDKRLLFMDEVSICNNAIPVENSVRLNHDACRKMSCFLLVLMLRD